MRAAARVVRLASGGQPLGVDPVAGQRLGEVGRPGDLEQGVPQIVVLGDQLVLEVAADLVEEVAPEGHRRVEERAVEQDGPADLQVRLGHRPDAVLVVRLVDQRDRAPDQAEAGVGVEGRDEPADVRWLRDVVRVQPGDDLSARGGDAAVGRGGRADVHMVGEDEDARVAQCDRLEDLAAAGRVVDDDQLEVGVLLREHAVHRLVEEAEVGPDGHHDRDTRTVHQARSMPGRVGRGSEPVGNLGS